MPQQHHIEHHIREFAYQIWESEGKPDGQAERHWEIARQLAEAQSLGQQLLNGDAAKGVKAKAARAPKKSTEPAAESAAGSDVKAKTAKQAAADKPAKAAKADKPAKAEKPAKVAKAAETEDKPKKTKKAKATAESEPTANASL